MPKIEKDRSKTGKKPVKTAFNQDQSKNQSSPKKTGLKWSSPVFG